jgi:hypothetical protein
MNFNMRFLFSKYSIIAFTFAILLQFTLYDFSATSSIFLIAISTPVILHAFIYECNTFKEWISIFHKTKFLIYSILSILLAIFLFFIVPVNETITQSQPINLLIGLFIIPFYQFSLIYYSQFATRKTFVKDIELFKLLINKPKKLIISSFIFFGLAFILPELILLSLISYFSFFTYFGSSEYLNEE